MAISISPSLSLSLSSLHARIPPCLPSPPSIASSSSSPSPSTSTGSRSPWVLKAERCRRGDGLRRAPRTTSFFCALSQSDAERGSNEVKPWTGLEKESTVNMKFAVGAAAIPHPDKVDKGGEDSYFVSPYEGGVLGIADGVSGWAEENVDPALFSRELMKHAATFVVDEEICINPQVLIEKAHNATNSVGAATVVIAALERKGILHIASVGDCGLKIVRGGNIIFSTTPQQHYFDCPYQLSSESSGQTASDALVHDVDVLEGDTIIMGSDGLFDNVYDREIETTVSLSTGPSEDSPQHIARALAMLASEHARDATFDSPYTQAAKLQGYDVPFWKKILGKQLTGGKLDDITILVGKVVDARNILGGDMENHNRNESTYVDKEKMKSSTIESG